MNDTEKAVCRLIGYLPEDYSKPTEEELNEFRAYISQFEWTTAKTYEEFAPHQEISRRH